MKKVILLNLMIIFSIQLVRAQEDHSTMKNNLDSILQSECISGKWKEIERLKLLRNNREKTIQVKDNMKNYFQFNCEGDCYHSIGGFEKDKLLVSYKIDGNKLHTYGKFEVTEYTLLYLKDNILLLQENERWINSGSPVKRTKDGTMYSIPIHKIINRILVLERVYND